MPPVAEIVQPV
jgi:hypothetical protein